MPTADELLLVPDDAIDYAELDAAILLELARQQDEPFIATSALGELAGRGVDEAHQAAEAILAAPWDRHLTAFALTVLFDRDATRGLAAMRRLPTGDAVILAAMIDNVLLEPEAFAKDRELLEELVARVEALPEDRFGDPEARADFLRRFRTHR